jgi:spore germination protein GerM
LVSVQVFFINSSTQQLQGEQRYVASPAPLTSVITAMLQGPAEDETPGVFTAIPSDVAVLSANPAPGNVVVVNMNAAFGQITGVDAELAVAQIVATVATEVGFTGGGGLGPGVIFEIDGQRTSVPVANGSEVNGPVYLLQFLGGPATA